MMKLTLHTDERQDAETEKRTLIHENTCALTQRLRVHIFGCLYTLNTAPTYSHSCMHMSYVY